MQGNLVGRFVRWGLVAIACGALIYLVGTIWAGIDEMGAALARFEWRLTVPILALTLVNYGLRFAKWHYLCRQLGIPIRLGENAWNFAAGLAMVISPGKAGELLKPYFVRARTGVPMAVSIPALITERLTDGIAMLALAAAGVTHFAPNKTEYILIPSLITVAGLAVLAIEPLSMAILRAIGRLPAVGRVAPKLIEMYRALRTTLAPVPLFVTIVASIVAWGAECIGYQLVFHGLGYEVPLRACVFLYAFATVAGGAMPGGLGVADGALAAGAPALVPGLDHATSVAAALLIRLATLWFGVAIGAFAILRVSSLVGGDLDIEKAPAAPQG
jgi:glycosyltransferase 2 family protein